MAFDPDAYLSKKPSGGGFDPDAYLAKGPEWLTPGAKAPPPVQEFANTGPVGEVQADLARRRQTIPSLGQEVAQPFIDIAKGGLAANDFATRAMFSPGETFKNPGATVREGLRGVNANIPFANSAVEAMGGPVAESPEDAAAAPGARAFGGVAGLPVGNMVGGIAAKGIEAAAPLAGRAINRVKTGAEERGVSRAMEELELRTGRRTRAGVKQGVVEDALRRDPALARAAGNDEKLAELTAAMKQRSGGDLDRIYSDHRAPPTRLDPLVSQPASRAAAESRAVPREVGESFDEFTAAGHPTVGDGTVADVARSRAPRGVDLSDSIAAIDKRIAALDAGTSSDAAVARQLEAIRDELSGRLGKRQGVTPQQLRAEQTDFQRKGYGKSMPGDDAGSARIAANREASRVVGDSVIRHVTGMDYAAARAASQTDPTSVAAQLLRANDTASAAYKIEATIADRALRVQPREGLTGKLYNAAKGFRHSPTGYVASIAPTAMAAGISAGDRALARIMGAVQGGQRPTEEMVSQAVRAGVKTSTITDLVNRRQMSTAGAVAEEDEDGNPIFAARRKERERDAENSRILGGGR